MIFIDTNVLLTAFRAEMPNHEATRAWLTQLLTGVQTLGLIDGILCGFVRVVTRKPFSPVTPVEQALDFIESLRSSPAALTIAPSPDQWNSFNSVCRTIRPHGKLVQDVYWASFALAANAEWITFDADFSRIPGLRWRSPLEPHARLNPR